MSSPDLLKSRHRAGYAAGDIRFSLDTFDDPRVLVLGRILGSAPDALQLFMRLQVYAAKHAPAGVIDAPPLLLEAFLLHGWSSPALAAAGSAIQALQDAGALARHADGQLEIPGWIEAQPLVSRSHCESVAGRYYKILGLARARGLSEFDAVCEAYERVPEYARTSGISRDEALERLESAPEQNELPMPGLAPSRDAALGNKPEVGLPRSRRAGGRQWDAAAVDAWVLKAATKYPAPPGVADRDWLRLLRAKRTQLRPTAEHIAEWQRDLEAAQSERCCTTGLIDLIVEHPSWSLSRTVSFNRSTLQQLAARRAREAQAAQVANTGGASATPPSMPTEKAASAQVRPQQQAQFSALPTSPQVPEPPTPQRKPLSPSIAAELDQLSRALGVSARVRSAAPAEVDAAAPVDAATAPERQ